MSEDSTLSGDSDMLRVRLQFALALLSCAENILHMAILNEYESTSSRPEKVHDIAERARAYFKNKGALRDQ